MNSNSDTTYKFSGRIIIRDELTGQEYECLRMSFRSENETEAERDYLNKLTPLVNFREAASYDALLKHFQQIKVEKEKQEQEENRKAQEAATN